MFCKEILSKEAAIGVEIIPTVTETEDGGVADFGLTVFLRHDGKEISRSVIPSISPDRDFVASLADQIISKRISPAYAADYIESKLSE